MTAEVVTPRRQYSLGEEIASAVTHGLGVALSVAAGLGSRAPAEAARSSYLPVHILSAPSSWPVTLHSASRPARCSKAARTSRITARVAGDGP